MRIRDYMKYFANIYVSVTLANEKMISWSMNRNYRPEGSVAFYVDKARSGGEWIAVGGPIVNACSYLDTVKWNWNKDKNTFYRVRFTPNAGSSWIMSAPVQAYGLNDHAKMAQIRYVLLQEVKLQRKIGAHTGVLLKKKEWGQPCGCVDHDTREPSGAWCTDCFNTGILGGYYTPIPLTMIALAPEKKERTQEDLGTVDKRERVMRCAAYPLLSTEDIWVSGTTGERWMLRSPTPMAEIAGVPVVMSVPMTLIPRSDVIYSDEADVLAESVPAVAATGTEHTWNAQLNCGEY